MYAQCTGQVDGLYNNIILHCLYKLIYIQWNAKTKAMHGKRTIYTYIENVYIGLPKTCGTADGVNKR